MEDRGYTPSFKPNSPHSRKNNTSNDYFSLRRSGARKNPSLSSTSGENMTSISTESFNLPKYTVNRPSSLGFFLSPILTSPLSSGLDELTPTSPSYANVPLPSASTKESYHNVLQELERFSYPISNQPVFHPHDSDFINASMADKSHLFDGSLSNNESLENILQEYNIKVKLDVENPADVISSYIAIHRDTKNLVIIRFAHNSTLGTVSRLVNSYYITSGLNNRVPRCGFPHFVEKLDWNYRPKTCPSDMEGVLRCTKINFVNDNSSIIAVHPIGEEAVPLVLLDIGIKSDIIKMMLIFFNLLKILKKLNCYGVVVNSLTPSNVLVNQKTLDVYLMGFDFAFSSFLEKIDSPYRGVNKTYSQTYLPFTAPENFNPVLSVDFRADMYSAGCIFYSMLSGRNLKAINTSLLITTVLTTKYQPLHEINNTIDVNFSKVIAKMTEVDPNKRYSSFDHILHDLSLIYFEKTSRVLYQEYKTTTFLRIPITIPSKVIGRDSIMKKLNHLIRKISVESVTLVGEQGVGKTTILQHLRQSCSINKVFYSYWKCHPRQYYNSRFQTFEFLLSQILKEILGLESSWILFWRNLFTTEVKADLSLLFDTVPEMYKLLGKRYKQLRRSNSKHSFYQEELDRQYIMKKLVELFARHAGWVLVIENIDEISENEAVLFEQLWDHLQSFEPEELNFTVLSSYTVKKQENIECDQEIPEFLKKKILNLKPLTFDNVEETVGLSLQLYDSQFAWKRIQSYNARFYFELADRPSVTEQRRVLAESIYRKTRGNPLMVKEILTQVHFSQMEHEEAVDPVEIYYKTFARSKHEVLSGNFLFDSVNDLGLGDSKTVETLQYAACITPCSIFNLYDLLVVTESSLTDTFTALFTGAIVGILEFCSNTAKLPIHLLNEKGFILNELKPDEKEKLLRNVKLQFRHESIKENIMKFLEPGRQEKIHRICGLRLFANIKGRAELTELTKLECYSIAYHFMCSIKIANEDEYPTYLKIIITAGWLAYTAHEYIAALSYFQTSMKLTVDNDILKILEWIEIHICFLKENHEKCIELVDLALEKYCTKPLIAAEFMLSKHRSLTKLNRWEESYEICIKILNILDFELDLSTMTDSEVDRYTHDVLRPKLPSSISEIRQLLRSNTINTDQRILMIEKVLVELNSFSVYLGKKCLVPFCNIMNVCLFLQYGKSIYCNFSMIVLASIEASIDQIGIKRAHEYCKLGFSMSNYGSMEAIELLNLSFRWYFFLVGSIIEPCEVVEQAFDSIPVVPQVLDSHFSRAILLKFKFHLWVTRGLTVSRLIERTRSLKESTINNKTADEVYDTMYSIVTGILYVVTGDITYEDYLKYSHNDETLRIYHVKLIFNTNKCFACYIFKRYEMGAEIALNEITQEWSEELASIELIWARFMSSLLIYSNQRRLINSKQPQTKDQADKVAILMKENRTYFQEVSTQNPSVFKCVYLIVDSLCMVLDSTNFSQIDILSAFETAVEACSEYQNFLLKAIVTEETARWSGSVSSSNRLANKYFKIAYESYKTWGLKVKVEQLEKELGDIVNGNLDMSHIKHRRRASTSLLISDLNALQQSSMSSFDTIPDHMGMKPNVSLERSVDERSSDSSILAAFRLKNNGSTEGDPLSTTNNTLLSESISGKLETASNGDSVYGDDEPPPSVGIESSSLGFSTEDDVGFKNEATSDQEWDNSMVMDLSVRIAQSNDIEDITKTLLGFASRFLKTDYSCLVVNSDSGIPFVKALGMLNDEFRFLDNEIMSLRGDLVPIQLVRECMKRNASIWRDSDKFYFDSNFKNRDPYYENSNCENCFCIPIRSPNGEVIGSLYLESHMRESFTQSRKIKQIEYVCLQSFISISKIDMLEKLQIAKEAAEEATADKTSFLANMSHEIRTPFNSLMSCAVLLLDTKLTKSQRMYVETIKNSALVTLNIVDGILSFSKLEHGSLALDYEPFNLTQCIEDSIQLIGDQISHKSLELVFIDDAYPFNIVFGDKTRVTQVIINLVGNASKFTSEGHILIRSSYTEVSESRYEFKIEVSDSGIGIPEGSKARLFKVFSQLDGSSKRIYGGSGLGLAISKKLAELMGGDLDYESTEGKGTRFFFTFTTKGEKDKLLDVAKEVQEKKVVMFDTRELSIKSLKISLHRGGIRPDNILVFPKVDEHTQKKAVGADYIFIFSGMITTKEELEELRLIFKKSMLIYQVPFATKIPEFVDFEGDEDERDRNRQGSKSMQNDSQRLVDFILFNPYKIRRISEILNGGVYETDSDKIKNSRTNLSARGRKGPEKIAEKYPLSILIAEDNMINMKVVKLQLQRLGYSSDHAKDGVEVIEKCLEKVEKDGHPYDLVFMDLQMPRKDGFEATVEAKELYGDSIRIVALSANVYAEEKNRCIKIGMSGFLNKPLLPEALCSQLIDTYYAKHGESSQ